MLASRGNLDSSGRTGALHAALRLIEARPLTGTGVGLARFTWGTGNGNELVALYAHNEYLQLAVDLGAIGLLLLAALAAAAATLAWRGRRYPQPPGVRAGAIGGLAAFSAHSAFDFLWHIPVLPLVAAILVGAGRPGHHGRTHPRQGTGGEMKVTRPRLPWLAAVAIGAGAALAVAASRRGCQRRVPVPARAVGAAGQPGDPRREWCGGIRAGNGRLRPRLDGVPLRSGG